MKEIKNVLSVLYIMFYTCLPWLIYFNKDSNINSQFIVFVFSTIVFISLTLYHLLGIFGYIIKNWDN